MFCVVTAVRVHVLFCGGGTRGIIVKITGIDSLKFKIFRDPVTGVSMVCNDVI